MLTIENFEGGGCRSLIKSDGSAPIVGRNIKARDCGNILEIGESHYSMPNKGHGPKPECDSTIRSAKSLKNYWKNFGDISWNNRKISMMKFTDVKTNNVENFYVGPNDTPLEVSGLDMIDGKAVVKIVSPSISSSANGDHGLNVILPEGFTRDDVIAILKIMGGASSAGADPIESLKKEPIWLRWLSAGGNIASIMQLLPLVGLGK
jgi:hypothetical protein